MSARAVIRIFATVLALLVAIVAVVKVRRWWSRPLATSPATVEGPTQRAIVPFDVAETILDGHLAEGWEDWGWGAHDATDGGVKLEFDGFGGIIFHHDKIASRFGALVFRFSAPVGYADFLEVALKSPLSTEDALPAVAVEQRHTAHLPDGMQEVMIPWAILNPTRLPFDQIIIRARRSVGSERVLIDRVVLTKQGPADDAGQLQVRQAKVAIDCRKQGVPINPLIYGIAQGVWDTGETGHRIGGNAMSRLNWDTGAWNTASDWFFENVQGSSGIWEWLDEVHARSRKVAVTVPIIGWVAKDTTSVGFPVSKFGQQRAHDPGRDEAGDGVAPNGSPITPGPPTLTSVAAPPDTIHHWIEKVRQKETEWGYRPVAMYILDNEPNLWSSTHRDVHPTPIGYDELLDRTIRYATAIRDADPDAVIAGPAEWGWSGYFFSAKDKSSIIPNLDRSSHGGVPLIPWYLERLARHEKETGVRLLDVVDVHFYPQADGVYGHGSRTDPDAAARRLRSTRALWDPSYLDESWIKEHVNLIPRLKDWIEKNYPGRGISIGEWSFGAEDHMSGALAIAEALGRFGQQGITSAFYWAKLSPNTPGFHAFRAFRNFDGEGGRFLDLALATQGADGVSVFASRDEPGEHMVAVVLNLDPDVGAETQIELQGCGAVTASRTFHYAPGMDGISEAPKGEPLRQVLPPYSITILDLTTAARLGSP